MDDPSQLKTVSRVSDLQHYEFKLTSAVVRHGTKHAVLITVGIGDVDVGRVGDEEAQTKDTDLGVEVVVGQVHEVVSCHGLIEVWGTLSSTREGLVLRGKGSLPHVRKLIEDIGHRVLVGLVIHEHHNALLGQNHLRECWPVI